MMIVFFVKLLIKQCFLFFFFFSLVFCVFYVDFRLMAMEDLTRCSWMLKWKKYLPGPAVRATLVQTNSMWRSSSAIRTQKTVIHNDSKNMTAIVSACTNLFYVLLCIWFYLVENICTENVWACTIYTDKNRRCTESHQNSKLISHRLRLFSYAAMMQ